MREESGIESTQKKYGQIQLGSKEDVYNLTVDDSHEFFANGVLVHNCDAFVYGAMGLINKPSAMGGGKADAI